MAAEIPEYRLSESVLDRARGLELPRRQWRVLFAFREPSPEDIINDLQIDEDSLRLTLVNLTNFGLLERRPMRHPATNGHAETLPEARHPAAPEEEESPAPEPEPEPEPGQAPAPPSRTDPRPDLVKPLRPSQPEPAPEAEPESEQKPEPTPAPKPEQEPAQPAVAAATAAPEAEQTGPLKLTPKPKTGVLLKPVIDFIQNSAGSGTLGQLTVYRVFLKIPPHLLKEARIQSVKFVDDNFRIESVELQKAIRSAVKRTLNKDVPEDLLPC